MEVQTWDAVFIRATRHQIHPVIADIAGWTRWWPGLTVATSDRAFALRLRPPGLARPTRRWAVELVKNRADLGIDLRYSGDVGGSAEFYYLDEPAGSVVHYVLRGDFADRGWRGGVRDHRAAVRAALDHLKDRFERGRNPGDEPEQALLEAQRDAMVAFAEGVAAWERRTMEPTGAAEVD